MEDGCFYRQRSIHLPHCHSPHISYTDALCQSRAGTCNLVGLGEASLILQISKLDWMASLRKQTKEAKPHEVDRFNLGPKWVSGAKTVGQGPVPLRRVLTACCRVSEDGKTCSVYGSGTPSCAGLPVSWS